MSQPTQTNQLNFFMTPAHDCPYLPQQKAKTVFLSPEIETDNHLYSILINHGFRRSGEHVYRPQCDNCQACVSVRIPVNQFKHNKQQSRCIKKSSVFRLQTEPAKFNQQHYQLFDKYISLRHQDGDMYPTSVQQYKSFILNDWADCNFLNLYDIKENKLISTSVYDVVKDGLSAVYTYFDPDYSKYSLGRLGILKLIELAKAQQLDYVYLGYWIKDSAKMSYKGQYRPLECYINNQWLYLS